MFNQYATYAAQQLPYLWAPNQEPYEVIAVSAKLHDVNFNPMFTLLPEYWYFTR